MKPTIIQIKIAKIIEECSAFWQSTNDINSPTHICNIEETVNRDLLEDLTDDERINLINKIIEIYKFIKQIK